MTIGDELLQEVLGRHSDAQMRSIVGTIQREQNRIIRNEQSRLLARSGRGGQRQDVCRAAARRLFAVPLRGTLSADQIVLFSPNPMFNSYVSTVLPEFGEENMQQTTFQDYLAARLGHSFKLENPYVQLEYALRAENRTRLRSRMAGIRYKATTGLRAADRRLSRRSGREGIVFRDVRFREEVS